MIDWLGAAFFDHLAGPFRAIGLALFLAAIVTDQAPNLVISAGGLMLIGVAPFLARLSSKLARHDDEARDDRDQ